MQRLKTYLYHHVTGKIAMVATVIFLLFTAIVLPVVATLSTDVIGVSESIDTNFQFNLDHIYSIVDSYGANGRRTYIILRWTFDVIFPFVYTGFLVSITAYFAKKVDCKYNEKVLYIALLAMGFDFLENIFATILMSIYPTTFHIIVYLLITASILKWTILGLAFLVPILLVGYLGYQKRQKQ